MTKFKIPKDIQLPKDIVELIIEFIRFPVAWEDTQLFLITPNDIIKWLGVSRINKKYHKPIYIKVQFKTHTLPFMSWIRWKYEEATRWSKTFDFNTSSPFAMSLENFIDDYDDDEKSEE